MHSNIFEEDEIKGEFKSIPIEQSNKNEVEVYHMHSYSNISYAKNKYRKKMIKYILIGIFAILVLYITKRFLWGGIKEIFYEDDNNNYDYSNYPNVTYNDRFNQSLEDDGLEYNDGEKLFLHQNISEKNMDLLSSPQLKNPKNIKPIDNLEITLEVEYDKYVHLKIKDSENKRWEIPKEEMLNKEYLYDLNENRIPLSIYIFFYRIFNE